MTPRVPGENATLPTEEEYRRIYRHTVPILDYDRGQPDQVGTGVLIVIDQREFVVTSAHVFEPGIRKVGFGYLDKQGFHVFGNEAAPILVARAQSGGGDPQTAVYKDDLDLSLITLDATIREALREHYRPFNLRDIARDSTAEWGVISGWPSRKNKFDARKKRGHFDTCYHIQCPILNAVQTRAAGFNPDIFLALSADKQKDFTWPSGKHVQLPKLEGMSGAGLWVNSLDPEKGWVLAGILVEDDSPKRMLKVIKAQYIEAPLREFLVRTKAVAID